MGEEKRKSIEKKKKRNRLTKIKQKVESKLGFRTNKWRYSKFKPVHFMGYTFSV
jgi:hypothetical protein